MTLSPVRGNNDARSSGNRCNDQIELTSLNVESDSKQANSKLLCNKRNRREKSALPGNCALQVEYLFLPRRGRAVNSPAAETRNEAPAHLPGSNAFEI